MFKRNQALISHQNLVKVWNIQLKIKSDNRSLLTVQRKRGCLTKPTTNVSKFKEIWYA